MLSNTLMKQLLRDNPKSKGYKTRLLYSDCNTHVTLFEKQK